MAVASFTVNANVYTISVLAADSARRDLIHCGTEEEGRKTRGSSLTACFEE